MIEALNIMSGVLFVLVLALATGRGVVAELNNDPAGRITSATPRQRQLHLVAKILLIVLGAALVVCLVLRMYVELR
ncbi:hypothetical protein [Actinoplanes sp. NPDC026619]|uniref:hypothetical protein n=1 Tax=Actinoplanes sp. NPDC026619 TaxID=3155798 RepID=UPI0033F623A5